MSQILKIGWIKAVGIAPVIFSMGFVLCKSDIMRWFGYVAIFISVLIATTYGVLGIFGILKNMEMIEIKKTTVSLDVFFNIFKRKK
ncbi:hypothetical protein KAR28_01460 [Candidatus Parcubacteria bacterium]|nr:hypothetical protein [Candidatus Parcubacteria bacterium]